MPCLLLILPSKYNYFSFRELETGLEKLANLSEVTHFRPVGTLFPQAAPTRQWVQLAAEEYVCVRAKSLQSCLTFCDLMDCSPSVFSVHGDSPGKNTGGGCHAFLQEIFPTRDQTHVSYVSCIGSQVLYY